MKKCLSLDSEYINLAESTPVVVTPSSNKLRGQNRHDLEKNIEIHGHVLSSERGGSLAFSSRVTILEQIRQPQNYHRRLILGAEQW